MQKSRPETVRGFFHACNRPPGVIRGGFFRERNATMPTKNDWKPKRYADAITGKTNDSYFSVGGESRDISGKLEAEQRRTANPGVVRR
jgi:hypothetical protein